MTVGFLGVIGLLLVCIAAVAVSLRKRNASARYMSDVVTGRILQLSLEAHQAMLREAIVREVGRL